MSKKKELIHQLAKSLHDYIIPLSKTIEKSTKAQTSASSTLRQYDPLMDAIGDCSVVLIGEASHGTEEFYKHRAEITKRLIMEKGFNLVCWEADWPDALRVNRFVKREKNTVDDKNADEALTDFKRFPQWMWRNTVVQDFVQWLRDYNGHAKENYEKVGIYGLDLYSMQSSREAVLAFLQKTDPEAAKRAKKQYECFDQYSSIDEYAFATGRHFSKSCEKEALAVLKDIAVKSPDWIEKLEDSDKVFYAKINAKVVTDAEEYYRKMFSASAVTWNIRDKHMCSVLQELLEFKLTTSHIKPKAVVWAHNSHLGDARATDMAPRELNLGQLARETFGMEDCFNIGFSTYTGSVTAAHSWDEPPHFRQVNNGLAYESFEHLFHLTAQGSGAPSSIPTRENFMLLFRSMAKTSSEHLVPGDLRDSLNNIRLMARAIGVIYAPHTERRSHYFSTSIARQFDALIHFDKTRAIQPLEFHTHWHEAAKDFDETYPTGL